MGCNIYLWDCFCSSIFQELGNVFAQSSWKTLSHKEELVERDGELTLRDLQEKIKVGHIVMLKKAFLIYKKNFSILSWYSLWRIILINK